MIAGANRDATVAGLTLRPFDPAVDVEPIAELISSTNAFDDLDWVMTVPSLRLEVAPGGQFDPDRDVRVASLGVDAENPTGALALYERLGFTRHRAFRVYRKAL